MPKAKNPKAPADANGEAASGARPEKPLLKVRFGQSHDEEQPPPARHYPFRRATDENVHALFRRLRVQCEQGRVVGVEPIVLEFLNAVALSAPTLAHLLLAQSNSPYSRRLQFTHQLPEPKDAPFREHLLEALEPQLSHLTGNGERRFPPALGNVIRGLKRAFRDDPPAVGAPGGGKEAVEAAVRRWLEDFFRNAVWEAANAIVLFTREKLERLNAATVLTYGWSPIVERVLLEHAAATRAPFSVTILDGEPDGTGTRLLRSLARRGVRCTYGGLNALAAEVRRADVVLLGAAAVLSNGNALARRGAAAVACLAKAHNRPLLVTVRTVAKHPLVALDREPLECVDAEMITALVTDIRILPPTSAPAVFKANVGRC
ncbi:hypothetical protein M3Y99_01376000 [Aphelenchoides fujianensis]|nr:hypothetical protein M3Y99_01376000 [Aphelenchoides fujianensis]